MMRGMMPSPLHSLYLRRGARMGREDGRTVPRLFSNPNAEHRAAAEGCGLFDISHLSKFAVLGNGALGWLENLLSNSVTHCHDGMGQSTLLLQPDGGIIDKLLLFRESAGRFFLLGHGARRAEVFDWLSKHRPEGALELRDESERLSGFGLCGPQTEQVLTQVLPGVPLPPPRGFRRLRRGDAPLILLRASLVGVDAYELFCPEEAGAGLFEALLSAGATPCGTETRECLRVEHAATAVGRDIGIDKTPVQAALERFCDLSKAFVGAEVLRRQSRAGTMHSVAALLCEQGGSTPQEGDRLIDAVGATVGRITSACLDPEDGQGRALAYVLRRLTYPGTRLRLVAGERRIPVIVTDTPVC